jgi:tetratricopeptide (TPR) repeat protein
MATSQHVFALRKEGRLDEALSEARSLLQQDNRNEWNVRALGWVLYDLVEKAVEMGDMDRARTLFQEFESLSIGGDDEALAGAREKCRKQVDERYRVLQEAIKASKEGQRPQALSLFRRAVRDLPESIEAHTGLGWEIQKRIKELCAQEVPEPGAIVSLLREYAQLHVEKPSPLHSVMLAYATKIAERFSKYIEFVRWWDLSNLRPEDYSPVVFEGGREQGSSLVERVIRALYKAGKRHKTAEDFGWIADFVAQNYERYPQQDWFPYYLGKMFLWAGRPDDARDLVLPVVRRKQDQFWAWDVLGGTYAANSPEKQFSCLCRSLLCDAQEEYLVNVRTELAEMLAARGEYSAAKREVELARASRQEKGWPLPDDLKRLMSTEWYQSADPADTNQQLYEGEGAGADVVLLDGLPWVDAVLVSHQQPSDGRGGRSFIGLGTEDTIYERPAKWGRFPMLRDLSEGTPLRVKLDGQGNESTIVAVEDRDAKAWDIFPSRIGVVSHINVEKGVSHVVLGGRAYCLLFHDRLAGVGELAPGTAVEVKLRVDRRHDKLHAVAGTATDESPSADFFTGFSGSIHLVREFGFVDDVFVPPNLCGSLALSEGDTVVGNAVREWDKKKGRLAWRAVTVKRG